MNFSTNPVKSFRSFTTVVSLAILSLAATPISRAQEVASAPTYFTPATSSSEAVLRTMGFFSGQAQGQIMVDSGLEPIRLYQLGLIERLISMYSGHSGEFMTAAYHLGRAEGLESVVGNL